MEGFELNSGTGTLYVIVFVELDNYLSWNNSQQRERENCFLTEAGVTSSILSSVIAVASGLF